MTSPTPNTDFAAALAGQYAIECEIGRGGMGVVYRARDLKLDRAVAIKTLPAHLADDPTIRERFLREARTAAALSHPNIVPVHRADEIAGHVFFVMGYVDGASLATRIRERQRLDPVHVARYLRDVASGLAYAHSRQVIHRDIKAENILIDGESDHAVVTDFGIARLAEAAPLTATGQMLGTVYYLSPEQILGTRVDARSDIYSLGVVGYFALSGRFPFDGELASAVLVAHVNTSVPPLRALAPHAPDAVVAIIERCLEKDPGDRYQSCDMLMAELEGVISGAGRATASDSRGATPLVSDTEAHAILHRAAELDSLTAAQPRPLTIPRQRDPVRDLTRTSGLRVDQVRDAALEAGIARRHVEHALGEHGLAQAPNAPAPTASAASAASARDREPLTVVELEPEAKSLVFGALTDLRFEVIVQGEMRASDFDVLAETLRRRTNNRGEVTGAGRFFHWETYRPRGMSRAIGENAPRRIEVAVVPANGTTSVFVRESFPDETAKAIILTLLLSVLAWALTEGVIVNITGGGLGSILATGWLGLLMGVESVGIFAGVRRILAGITRKRRAFLRTLAEALGVQARDSAAAGVPALAASPPPPRLATSSAG